MPDQAGSAARDLQGMVPAVILHDEERSSPGKLHRCGDLQSPRTRALFALKPGARSPRTHKVHAHPSPPRHETPAHSDRQALEPLSGAISAE